MPQPPFHLVAGLAMRGAEMAPLVHALAVRGFAAASFDNLAVGAYADAAAAPGIDAMARHGWTMAPAGPVHLFGLSMGGMVAAAMAAQQPHRVASLSLAATSANAPELPAVPDDLDAAWRGLASRADLAAALAVNFSRTARARRPELLRDYVEYRLAGGNGQSRRAFQAQLDALRAFDGARVLGALRSLAAPKLVIAGAEDELFPLPHAHAVARLCGARLEVLPATGHLMTRENADGLAALLAPR